MIQPQEVLVLLNLPLPNTLIQHLGKFAVRSRQATTFMVISRSRVTPAMYAEMRMAIGIGKPWLAPEPLLKPNLRKNCRPAD
jgi:hypothetical protein